MSTLLQDLRLSVRLLRRSRGFAAAALAVIALSTGASTAVFSVVYSVVLRPLPFPEPGRLVSLTQFYASFKENVVTGPVYFDWLDGASQFASLAAYSAGQYTLTGAETAESVPVARVSHQFFDCLGVRPASGRTFSAQEGRPGSDGVVVVSRSFWNGRRRRDLVELEGRGYRVIGEMPESFAFPPATQLWVPLALDPARERAGGPVEMVRVIGRLKSGVTAAGLTATLAGISARVQGFSAGGRPVVVPLRLWLTGKTQRVWFVLTGVVVIVLLVACANVAGLLIARGAARRSEMAIRLALGAPAHRLVRQLLTESLVLAVAGSAAGLALAALLVRVLLPLVPDAMLAGRSVQLDAPVFACATATAVAIALLFGIAPAREALRTTRQRPLDLRGILVAAEVALSLVLLVAAALMVRSFSALTAVDPGFRADHALTLAVNLPAAAYREPPRQFQFYRSVLDALAALPGVRGAALASELPFSGGSTGFALASAEGERPWNSDEGLRHRVDALFISAGYFRAAGTPLVEGREFTAGEMTAESHAVIVNRALARRYFGAEHAIGRRIKLGFVESPEPWRAIVGVARDSKRGALDEDVAPAVYRPYTQRNGLRVAGLILRTTGDPAALAEPVRRTLARLDGAVAASDVQTLEQRLNRSVASQKLRSVCSVLLALLALAMVVTGLYGVLAYLVAQRMVELGVRMALGAAPGDIFALVLRRGAKLALAGIAAGALLSLAAGQSLRGLLFGVTPADPWILLGASALMLAVSLAAAALPARRAIRIDPMRCLRQE
ncbi:MAG: ADOP family duplicated permease [Candidatus Sulfopaludibacter sp.]|nr:ADOP family duplicated permease [Candidatus Sulfopaludibacter sp.]